MTSITTTRICNTFFFLIDDDNIVQIVPSGKESCFDCFEYNYINASYIPVQQIVCLTANHNNSLFFF